MAVDTDGLGAPGERIESGDVYVNKQTPVETKEMVPDIEKTPYSSTPMRYKSPIHGYIDKVLLTNMENDQILIKVNIRQTRRPELGDKFSSRHGQKGVCGLIVNQEDLPFNDQGINPGNPDSARPLVPIRELIIACRYNHESSRIPIPNDCRKDDRTLGWEGDGGYIDELSNVLTLGERLVS